MKHPHCPLSSEPLSKLDEHKRTHRVTERKRLTIVMILTGTTMVVEFVGGVLTNSLALISDAGHMLTHFLALTVSFTAIVIASRPTKKEYSFGLYRIEVLAALFNGIVILIIAIYIFYEAYIRILHPQPIAEVQMFMIALIGLGVNLVSAVILSGVAKADLNVRSAFYHMLGDTISSVGVVAGAIIIFITSWYTVDPLIGLMIGIVILYWAGKLLVESVNIFLESTPKHINVDAVAETIKTHVKEVRDIHDIHIWEITSNMYAMTAHIGVRDMMISESAKLLKQINTILEREFGIGHTNIQFEVIK